MKCRATGAGTRAGRPGGSGHRSPNITHTASAFARNACGNVAVIFGLAAGALALAAVGAMDYASSVATRSNLQAAADAAATASARELYLVNADDRHVRSVAETIATAKLVSDSSLASYTIDAVVNSDRNAVTTTINSRKTVAFAGLLGSSETPISVDATAQIVGTGRICAIGLESSQSNTVYLEKSARLTAKNCAVFSNSTSKFGISAHNSSRLTSEFTCSAGGYKGASSNYRPVPETDCPAVPDPLAQRPPPPIGSCVARDLRLTAGTHSLKPGTYCGGITLTKTASVTLKPGIFVIKDGPLIVDKTAKLKGDYVGLYFAGDKATLKFAKDALIDLGAPKDGPMAGLLFFGDRSNKEGKKYRIESNNARNLLGTIYFPKGDLEIEAKNPIADKSAYTVVVARRLNLADGPELVLNARYEDTDVPVPAGVGPVGGNIVLVD